VEGVVVAESDADDQAGAELDEINPFSGEKIIHVPESEELRLAREARWNAATAPVNSSILKQQQEAATAEVASAVVSEDVDVMSGASNMELWKSIYREATNGQSISDVPIVDQQLGVIEEKATADSHAINGSTCITENRHHHHHHLCSAAGDAASSQSTVPQLSEKKSKFISLLTESIEEVSSVSTVVHHHPKVHDMEELD